MKKHLKKVIITCLLIITAIPLLSVSVMATQSTSQTWQPQTTNPSGTRPLENDFHTAQWQRFSHNYQFSTGPDFGEVFGRPTQTDLIPFNQEQGNIRRNAGASFNPPPFGVGNGVFPTDRNNIFAHQSPIDFARNITNSTGSNAMGGGFGGSVGSGTGTLGGNSIGTNLTIGGNMLPPTSILGNEGMGETSMAGINQISNNPLQEQNQGVAVTRPPDTITQIPNPELANNQQIIHTPPAQNNPLITAPAFFPQGHKGQLTIPRIGLDGVRVFHGSSYGIIDNHIGHFPTTSAWDGNIGLLAHNGGRAGYFGNLHLLQFGDTITYTTPFGTRVYEVISTHIIHETDFSLLGWSHENMITLVTCVHGQANARNRLVVVAMERR